MGGAEVTGTHTDISRSETFVRAAGKETLITYRTAAAGLRKSALHLTFSLLIRSRS